MKKAKKPHPGIKYLEGAKIRYVWWLAGGAAITLPGIGIFMGNDMCTDEIFSAEYIAQLLMHEYGHILQAKQKGWWFFYTRIAPASLFSALWEIMSSQWRKKWASNRGRMEQRPIYEHCRAWTERDANRRAAQYFNCGEWNTRRFPF